MLNTPLILHLNEVFEDLFFFLIFCYDIENWYIPRGNLI